MKPRLCVSGECDHWKTKIDWYEMKHQQRRDQVYQCMDQNAALRIENADLKAELAFRTANPDYKGKLIS